MRPFLVDKVLPVRAIHLFGGPSGAGKTRLLFQWIQSLCQGKQILNLTVPKPIKIAYVCLDRSLESVSETLECLEIDPATLPNFEFISYANRQITLAEIPTLFTNKPDLLIIDGIPALLPSGDINKYTEVANFMRLCLKICEQYNLTIIGILHCAKTKENERYLNPRQRISGSSASAAFSETILLLEPIKPESVSDKRTTLTVLPRNAAMFSKDYTFNDKGQLVEYNLQVEQDKYNLLLELIPADNSITRDNILDLAFNLGIGRSQCDVWLKQCIEDGLIIKPEYGKSSARNPTNNIV